MPLCATMLLSSHATQSLLTDCIVGVGVRGAITAQCTWYQRLRLALRRLDRLDGGILLGGRRRTHTNGGGVGIGDGGGAGGGGGLVTPVVTRAGVRDLSAVRGVVVFGRQGGALRHASGAARVDGLEHLN